MKRAKKMRNHRKTYENKGRSLHICREIGENTEKNAISPICRPYFGEIEKKICLSPICPKSPPPAGAHQARRRPTMQPKICSLPRIIKPAGGRQCNRSSSACRGSSSPPEADNATEDPPSAGGHQAHRWPTMQPKIRSLLRIIKPAGGRQCNRKSRSPLGIVKPAEDPPPARSICLPEAHSPPGAGSRSCCKTPSLIFYRNVKAEMELKMASYFPLHFPDHFPELTPQNTPDHYNIYAITGN